jgi:hypothetical protein
MSFGLFRERLASFSFSFSTEAHSEQTVPLRFWHDRLIAARRCVSTMHPLVVQSKSSRRGSILSIRSTEYNVRNDQDPKFNLQSFRQSTTF